MFPFPEVRVNPHVDQRIGDRTVTQSLLYLEQVGARLIVVKRMSMTKGMEAVSPFLPVQFMETVFEYPPESAFADMGTRSLTGKELDIQPGAAAVLFPVLQ